MLSQRLSTAAIMRAAPRGWCAAGRRWRAPSSTATRITTPLMNICQNAEMPTSGKLLRMTPRNRQPSTTPSAEPDAAGDGDAADQAGRDHLQLEAERDVGVGHREARHPQVAAHPGDGARRSRTR